VHARGGERSAYHPVESLLAPERPGDPLLLARRYRERLGAGRCYVADLDALTGRMRQLEWIRRLADPVEGFGAGLLVDSAVTDPDAAQRLLEAGATTVIVALESLPGPGALTSLCRAIGPARLLVSLDLRDGKPIVRPSSAWADAGDAVRMAAALVAAGADRMIVLDLARVGRSEGPPFDIIQAVRAAHPSLTLLSGGGVRHAADLARLGSLGVSAALVATALHEGRLAGYIASR